MYQVYIWKDSGYISLYSENIDKFLVRSKDPADFIVKARQLGIYISEYRDKDETKDFVRYYLK